MFAWRGGSRRIVTKDGRILYVENAKKVKFVQSILVKQRKIGNAYLPVIGLSFNEKQIIRPSDGIISTNNFFLFYYYYFF